MKFQMVNSYAALWAKVQFLLPYFQQLEKAGPPPRGVAGKRIAGGFRSVADVDMVKKLLDEFIAKTKSEIASSPLLEKMNFQSNEARENYILAKVKHRAASERQRLERLGAAAKGKHDWRLAYVIDTYGGRAYRGSARVEIKKDPPGRWFKVLAFTVPA